MVWVIAAVLHIAVGSVTISAITSAGILAPVAPLIGLDPVLIALAAGAGSLFAVHVTSNTFWLLQSLLGQIDPRHAEDRHGRCVRRLRGGDPAHPADERAALTLN